MKGDENKFILPSNSTGFIVGLRFWKRPHESMRHKSDMFSMSATHVWPSKKPMEAKVPLQTFFDLPDANKYSGVFACKLVCLTSSLNLSYTHEYLRRDGELVHGLVALWGEVIEHEYGYRAQYAYPLTLSVARHADHYGTDLLRLQEGSGFSHPFESLKKYLKANLESMKPANEKDLVDFLQRDRSQTLQELHHEEIIHQMRQMQQNMRMVTWPNPLMPQPPWIIRNTGP